MHIYDALVIGGGISGVSIAYELSTTYKVGVLDMEAQLAYHTSGRSVATFLESYGGPVIRALTTGSRSYFEDPIDEMRGPLLSPLGLLWLGRAGQLDKMRELYDEVRDFVSDLRILDRREVQQVNPAVREGYAESALYEPGAMRIDVDRFHGGYVRAIRRRGSGIHTLARVTDANRVDGHWLVRDAAGEEYKARIVINAAGAWVDEVGLIFGAKPIGIEPRRRTAFIVAPPEEIAVPGLPLTGNIEDTWYFMPQGDALTCSPADKTLVEPHDAKPDESEIARAIGEINEATLLSIRSIKTAWAGLRNFVADHVPVVDYDPEVEDFFWYAGQGGYGMQIAPSLSRTGAAFVRGEGVPPDLVRRGLSRGDLAADRGSLVRGWAH